MTILMGLIAGTMFRRSAPTVIPVIRGAVVSSFVASGEPFPEVETAMKITPNVSLADGTPVQMMLQRMVEMTVDVIRDFGPAPGNR